MSTTSLTGKRILVVEDEYFIASDLSRALRGQGAIVVGPAANSDRGLALLHADDELDAAVLDVNLEGSNSYAIVDRLSQDQVPCMFVTGYDDWSLPERYRDIPRITKPFTMSNVIARVEQLVAGGAAS